MIITWLASWGFACTGGARLVWDVAFEGPVEGDDGTLRSRTGPASVASGEAGEPGGSVLRNETPAARRAAVLADATRRPGKGARERVGVNDAGHSPKSMREARPDCQEVFPFSHQRTVSER